MLPFSARSASEANWKSPSVPGEVEHDEVRVVCRGGGGGGQVGADEVHRAGLELHDHGGGAVSAGGLIWASGIWGRQVSYQMVPDWAVQRPPARSAMPWGGVGAAGGGEADDVGVVVGARHVHLGHSGRRSWIGPRWPRRWCRSGGGVRESQAVETTSSSQPLASQMRWAIITS